MGVLCVYVCVDVQATEPKQQQRLWSRVREASLAARSSRRRVSVCLKFSKRKQ